MEVKAFDFKELTQSVLETTGKSLEKANQALSVSQNKCAADVYRESNDDLEKAIASVSCLARAIASSGCVAHMTLLEAGLNNLKSAVEMTGCAVRSAQSD